ncbi:MAG: YIP1 family protein [Anaerolineae bacterium]
MSNRQIQPVRSREMQIIRQPRPRSLWGQVWTLALQPNTFFEALPRTNNARQWFWVAVLILALNGLSAVRQEALANGSTGGGEIPLASDFGGDTGSLFSGGGGAVVLPGGKGGGGGPNGPTSIIPDTPVTPAASTGDISSTWVTALISGSHIVLGWFVLALLLCEVPLFNGLRPSYGQNLQIAIWTSVPLGVMAGLQLIFLAAGGKPGAAGLSGLLVHWESFTSLPVVVQSLILSLASRFTVFWVWTLVLIYIGARTVLDGKHWAVALVVIAWVLVLVVVPVATGAIAVPTPAADLLNESGLTDSITLPDEGKIPNEGALPLESEPTIEGEIDTQPTQGFLSPGSGVLNEVTPEADAGN